MYKNYMPSEALKKIKHYCAYQERCHLEVKNKLYEFGLKSSEIEEIVSQLIEENYLNEERYATLFAGGKFRIKQWGKNKIKYELKQNQISAANIKKAIQQIDEDDYLKTLLKLYQNHFLKQKGKELEKIYKTKKYLIQKGFEIDLINTLVKEIY